MNWQTKKKAEEIKKLLAQGYTQKDVLEKKFNRSRAKLDEHIETAQELYTLEELKVLKGDIQQPVVKEAPIQSTRDLPPVIQLLSKKDSFNALEMLIKNSDKILAFIKDGNNRKNNIYAETLLDIPKEYLKFDDIKLKSVRLSEEVSEKFDKFCKKQKGNYSKTALLNFAIIEFIEKYSE